MPNVNRRAETIVNVTNASVLVDHPQLVFGEGADSVALPCTSNDKYESYPEEIGSKLEMISGRVVWEVRGKVQKIRYSYDAMDNTTWRKIARYLRSSQAFIVQYLPDDGDNMRTGMFICDSLTSPKLAFQAVDSDGNIRMNFWHGLEFTLREVSPHD